MLLWLRADCSTTRRRLGVVSVIRLRVIRSVTDRHCVECIINESTRARNCAHELWTVWVHVSRYYMPSALTAYLSLCWRNWSRTYVATERQYHYAACLLTELHACVNNLPQVDSCWSQVRLTSRAMYVNYWCNIRVAFKVWRMHSNRGIRASFSSTSRRHHDMTWHDCLSSADFCPLRTRDRDVFTMRPTCTFTLPPQAAQNARLQTLLSITVLCA